MSVGYRAFATALVFVFVTIAFVLIFTGEPRTVDGQAGGNFVRNILFDFQTLITGVLALAAAWWTVRTMQVADEKANLRHNQAMELATRSDRLKLERALTPQYSELRQCLSHAITTQTKRQPTEDDAGALVEVPFRDYVFRIVILYARISGILDLPHFKEGEALFGGQLMYAIWDLRKRTAFLADDIQAAQKYYGKEFEPDFVFDDWLDEGGPHNIDGYVDYCVNVLPVVLQDMERIAKMYQIDL
ncbi:hypothetical protein ACIQUG_27335 [Ensifer sp. NPDC090286]|uniref:hypothetical protein n=1 Tax=Ensifer sp. NPDC090286 TaxID=3363991 RepID=UPI00383A7405